MGNFTLHMNREEKQPGDRPAVCQRKRAGETQKVRATAEETVLACANIWFQDLRGLHFLQSALWESSKAKPLPPPQFLSANHSLFLSAARNLM